MPDETTHKRSTRAASPNPGNSKKNNDEGNDRTKDDKSSGSKMTPMTLVKVAVVGICLFAAYKYLEGKVNVKEGLESS